MKLLKSLALAMVMVMFGPITAMAQERISVKKAQQLAEQGDVLLIDIRTPGEWRRTGVSPLAETLNMHSPTFGPELLALIEGNRDLPIALICATGGRSGHMSRVMSNAGFTAIYDVTEGMNGSSAGPGWIAEGLDTINYNADQ